MGKIGAEQEFMRHPFGLQSPCSLAAGHGGHYLIRFAMHQQNGRAGRDFASEAIRPQKRAGIGQNAGRGRHRAAQTRE
jgi:hypothetical protein